MNIPVLPSKLTPLIANDGKSIHDEWHMFFTQWVTEMQKQASNEAIVMPKQSTDNIATLSTKSAYPFSFLTRTNAMDPTSNAVQLTNDGVNYADVYTRPQQMTTAQIAAIPASRIDGTLVWDTDTQQLKYGVTTSAPATGFGVITFTAP